MKYDLFRYGAGYLLDVQDDYLSGLNTRIVVPVLPAGKAAFVSDRLNPEFAIGGEAMVLETHLLAAVLASALGKPVGSLAAESDRITRALDFAFHGF